MAAAAAAAAPSSARTEKVRHIFTQFDLNSDGGLDRSEMSALVVAVNPRVKFSPDQISAILDEVFRTYSDFILPDAGLSFPGLLRTYDDGAGDVDRDFDALALALPTPTTSVDSPTTLPRYPRPAWAQSPHHAVSHSSTWGILEDLDLICKRLKSKQGRRNRKTVTEGINNGNNNNNDSFSDAGWSREIGPDSSSPFLETGPEYQVFVKELAGLRARADGARSREEAFDNHMAIGRDLYERRLFNDALVAFRRACELQPTDVRPHYRAGNALYAVGRSGEAREEFLLALEAAEASGNVGVDLLPQIHVNLGVAMEAEGMLLGACEHYREAAILCPTHFRALKLLGSALFGVGEYKAAEKALEEAVFLRPDYADAHCDLGSALHAVGDDERAIQEFQKAIDLKPDHVDALYNLGGLYMDAGRFARASEMYTRVLGVRPNHWRAQLNKAVALLGASENDEARKALKEAFKMTKRVEVYDAIAHLNMTRKKKKKKPGSGNGGSEGESVFLVIEASKFKRVSRKVTLRQDLATAIEIRAFQRVTRLGRCEVDLLKKEMSDSDLPVSYSGSGRPEKSIRKAPLEIILRKLLRFLKAETFQGSVKEINERVLSVMDASGTGRLDLGMFFAVLAPICSGPMDRRKRVVFDALLWRPDNESSSGQIKRCDAVMYLKLLRAVYIPSHGVSDMMEMHGESDTSMISFAEFLEMFNDPDWGFGILDTLVKLEAGDRIRHGRHTCSICRYPIIGSRFKETKHHFNLCNRCYSEGKVPSVYKQEEYWFKEYGSENEAMKDKCTCFNINSKSAENDP